MTDFISYLKVFVMSAWMKIFAGRGPFRALLSQTSIVKTRQICPLACDEMIAKIETLTKVQNQTEIWQDVSKSDTRIYNFENHIQEHLDLFNIPAQVEAIDRYTGRKTKSWFLMANRVLPKENNLGSGGGMHRDSPFSHQVKCIWYLNKVGSENGPFQYIAGTNIHLFRNRSKYPLGKTRFVDVPEQPQEVHADAGSLLICDTKCIHGGKPIKSGVRHAVTLYTFPQAKGAKMFLKRALK